MNSHLLSFLIPLFFLTALAYSMVGFAGGSTYLALLAIVDVSYQLMPVTALTCNIIVALAGSWIYFRSGHFAPKNILPFLITSFPMAFIGGSISISKNHFLFLLGIVLLIASLRLFLTEASFGSRKEVSWKTSWLFGLPIGAILGLVSGMTGIGGGILLAPVLYFLGWGNAKQVSAAASLFILINSIFGLWGQLSKNGFHTDWILIVPLGVAVFLGGQIGSRLGAQRFSRLTIQRLTGVLIMIISLKLIWGAWHA